MKVAATAVAAVALVVIAAAMMYQTEERPPINVGVLHSLSGTMAISERSVVQATLLAID